MKQPQLGQKIQEWRKAKGMTQEELVELCNINVRTIQRIEAGEVTPRPYTVKAILEVLQIDEDFVEQDEEHSLRTNSKFTKWYRYSFIAGIIYLILAIIETVVDVSILGLNEKLPTYFAISYTLLKAAVLIPFVIFTIGFFWLGKQYEQLLLQVMSVLLILFTAGFIIGDIITFWMGISEAYLLVLKSVLLGAIYALFAVCFLILSRKQGSYYLITGAAGIITGVSFLSVIFAIPGLFILTIFEILLIALLYQSYQQAGPPQGVPAS